MWRMLWVAYLAGCFVGCATPAQRIDEQAQRLGLTRLILQGTHYAHVLYRNAATSRAGLLHVYLEGDGRPWLTPDRIAADPTPLEPLALELMAQDNAPSLYLGRPCYYGQAAVAPCHPLLWTSRRYAPEIVESMAAALQQFLRQSHKRLVFIGYSGGGALAMLLAERFPQTQAVVTIAGNLDTQRWAAWHGYDPLRGSLNPATQPPLRSAIVQLHFSGGRDENISESLVAPVVFRQPCARFIVIKTFDHVCCWETTWPFILARLQAAIQDSERNGALSCKSSAQRISELIKGVKND